MLSACSASYSTDSHSNKHAISVSAVASIRLSTKATKNCVSADLLNSNREFLRTSARKVSSGSFPVIEISCVMICDAIEEKTKSSAENWAQTPRNPRIGKFVFAAASLKGLVGHKKSPA